MTQTLPAEVRILAGQLEDALTTWHARDPQHWHPQTRAAGDRAVLLAGEIEAVFREMREDLAAQLAAYEPGHEPTLDERELDDALANLTAARAVMRDLRLRAARGDGMDEPHKSD